MNPSPLALSAVKTSALPRVIKSEDLKAMDTRGSHQNRRRAMTFGLTDFMCLRQTPGDQNLWRMKHIQERI